MTKITPDHLARSAFVYIRQSTATQVTHNVESQRRQYSLVDRARHLGWENVEVIDDDLGRSGSGVRRPGFGVTGTHCWSSVVSLARLLSMRTVFMIQHRLMIGFFWV
jgi:hypothetical protein